MKSPANQRFLHSAQWVCGAWRAKRFIHYLRLYAMLPLLLACGCSTFNRDWKKAAQHPTPIESIEGRWEGQWLSEVNMHTGKLRCVITRESDDCYAARFQATYAKVFGFNYTVSLEIQRHYGGWEVNGGEDLGKLAGGVYYYEGRASATNFFSTYRSKYDHGTFEMRRPE